MFKGRLYNLLDFISDELNDLGGELVKIVNGQDNLIHAWMKKHVEFEDNNFLLPERYREFLTLCGDISEIINYKEKIKLAFAKQFDNNLELNSANLAFEMIV